MSSTKKKKFTEVKLGIKFPSVFTSNSWSYRSTPLPGLTSTLANKVRDFTPKVTLYTQADSDVKFVRKEKNFPVNGGTPTAVRGKFKAVVDYFDEIGEDNITEVWADSWGDRKLYITAYVPATQKELDLFEAEKVRAQALADEVNAAKAKYREEEKARRAAAAKAEKERKAKQRAADKKAAAERKAQEAKEAEANTVAHALKVLKDNGYTIEAKAPAKKKAAAQK